MSLVPAGITLGDDWAALIHTVGEFAEHELLPRDRQWDLDETSVAGALPKLAEMGLLNLLMPAEDGGLGCCYRLYAAIIHELAVWSPSTAVTVSVHNMVGGILQKFAPLQIRESLLPNWGMPENFGAFLVSEANAGSDAGGIRTMATRVDGGYRLTGEKMWVTNGMSAKWFFVLARLAGAPPHSEFCALLVDAHLPGISRDKIRGKLGIRGSETAVVHFNDVFVPETHLLGIAGKGKAVALETLHGGRIGIAAQSTGIAEACLREMTSYACTREQFGHPIGRFQAIGNMIADSAVELEAAKCLVWRAGASVDAGEKNRTSSSMAKLYASEAANRIAYRAVQVHGGAGYVRDCRVEQLLRDARITSIYEGTSEIQRIVLAREMAGV